MFDVWFFINIILIILFVLFIFTAMIDSIGGPVKVNNMLSTLNIPPIGEKNLIMTLITFLFSKNKIQMKIFILITT